MGTGSPKSDVSLKPGPGSLRNAEDAGLEGSHESDEALMARFCEGERRAFEKLFERYRRPIRTYLSRLVGVGSAEDLAQATFLSVVRARGRFDRNARFRPWLYTIATNAARDHLRRHRENVTGDGQLPSEISDPGGGPASRDEGMERAVQRALGQLPEGQRLAIVMHRFQNFSFAEIAQALDLSESAVKVRAHRGYKRLRELLEGIWKSE